MKMQRRSSFLFAVLVFALSFPRISLGEDSESGAFNLHDHFSFENRIDYKFRYAGGEHDSDFSDYWNLRLRNLLDSHLDMYFSGREHKDLDGSSNFVSRDLFSGVDDRDSGWADQVYQLYADLHDSDDHFGVRLGRQYIDDADSLHITGAQLRLFDKTSLSAKLFLGRPVSYYSSTSGDWAGGFSVTAKPFEGNRTRLTYVRYDEERTGQNDDRLTLDVWQRVGEEIRAHGRVATIDQAYQMSSLNLYYFPADKGLDVVAGISHWQGLRAQSTEYSPLYAVLGALQPYTYLSLRVTKEVLPWLSVSPGAAFRLMEESDRDQTNRQYGHYDLTFLLKPSERWNYTFATEYWDVSQGEHTLGLSGEVAYRSQKAWDVALGTAYLDYKYYNYSDYNYFIDGAGDFRASTDGTTTYVTQISPDAYTLYARANWKITKAVRFQVRGEMENYSSESDTSFGIGTSLILRF